MTKRLKKFDYTFAFLVGALLVSGLLVMFSASTVESLKNFGNTSYYFTHQLLYGGLGGLVAMYVLSRIDYHVWQKLAPLAVVGSLILLLLVKVPGISFEAGGASRWIHLGFITFQPSEIAKLAIIFYISAWVSKRSQKIDDFYYGILPTLVIVGLFVLLIVWQPDVGTMLVVASTSLLMLFTAGINLKHLAGIIGAGIVAMAVIIRIEPYRMQRLITFLNPSHDKLGISYQINQALLAIGSGGLFGYGYGYSRQKHSYLPEPIGDSIFAIMAEELGLLRVIGFLLLFIAFIVKGMRIASKAPDTFGKMLAAGITLSIGIQAVINIGAILGILPLTGIPLPFFSYGSTSLLVTLAGCGIVLNVSRST